MSVLDAKKSNILQFSKFLLMTVDTRHEHWRMPCGPKGSYSETPTSNVEPVFSALRPMTKSANPFDPSIRSVTNHIPERLPPIKPAERKGTS